MLRQNNEKIHKFISENSDISKIIDSKMSPEKLFNRLVEKGSVDEIKKLSQVLPEEVFNDLKSAYLSKLVKLNPKTGSISYKNTLNAINKKNRQLTEFFADDETLQDVLGLLKVGKKSGDAILNYSGTDVSRSFRDYLKSLITSGQDEVTLEAIKNRARKRATKEAVKKAVPKKAKPSKPISTIPAGVGISGLMIGDERER